IDKYCDFRARKYEIRASRQPGVEPVPQSATPENPSEPPLCIRITGPDTPHLLRLRKLAHEIIQSLQQFLIGEWHVE
ncbi:MAG TPA: hypothetical protein VE913_08110, partial [Longimicrobium sp.]|nr:hypothetical protein [Longimicrobium sp.]